ncbi:MAG: polysaccharide deacetylase family protein, partial [Armatimonadota bacterium]
MPPLSTWFAGRTGRLMPVAIALLLAALSALVEPVRATPIGPRAHVTGQTARSGRSDTRETAQLLPVRVTWPGECRITLSGVHHTRRLTVDRETGRPIGVEVAFVEPRLVHSHQTGGDHPPRMALTFDDGPSVTYTPQILQIFAENDARCTFFVLGGRVGGHRQILR